MHVTCETCTWMLALAIHHGPCRDESLIHCPLFASVTSCEACSCAFDQRSVGTCERSVGRSAIDHTESSERSWTLPVNSVTFFSLSLELQQSASEMARSSMQISTGIRVQQTPKVLRVHSPLADGLLELTMALKRGTTDKQSPK